MISAAATTSRRTPTPCPAPKPAFSRLCGLSLRPRSQGCRRRDEVGTAPRQALARTPTRTPSLFQPEGFRLG
jgi:hypothetical protein